MGCSWTLERHEFDGWEFGFRNKEFIFYKSSNKIIRTNRGTCYFQAIVGEIESGREGCKGVFVGERRAARK